MTFQVGILHSNAYIQVAHTHNPAHPKDNTLTPLWSQSHFSTYLRNVFDETCTNARSQTTELQRKVLLTFIRKLP